MPQVIPAQRSYYGVMKLYRCVKRILSGERMHISSWHHCVDTHDTIVRISIREAVVAKWPASTRQEVTPPYYRGMGLTLYGWTSLIESVDIWYNLGQKYSSPCCHDDIATDTTIKSEYICDALIRASYWQHHDNIPANTAIITASEHILPAHYLPELIVLLHRDCVPTPTTIVSAYIRDTLIKASYSYRRNFDNALANATIVTVSLHSTILMTELSCASACVNINCQKQSSILTISASN